MQNQIAKGRRDAEGNGGPDELRAALRRSASLRAILMAREPTGGPLSRGGGGGGGARPEWLPEWVAF